MCSLLDQAPANWKSRTERATDKNVVIQIPDRCLTRGAVVKQIIGFAITIKVGCGYQSPAAGNGRPPGGTNESCSR